MSSKTQPQLGFRINGAYITQTARTLMFEQGWRKGYSLLVEGLDGMDAHTALAVLSGTKRLEGVNTLEVVDDNCAQTVAASFNRLFRGCFDYKGATFRPYGVVTHYSQDDYRFSLQVAENGFGFKNNFWRGALMELSTTHRHWSDSTSDAAEFRPLMYAENPTSDVLVYISGHVGRVAVLCERLLDEIPLWITLPSQKEAVQALLHAEWSSGRLRDLTPLAPSVVPPAAPPSPAQTPHVPQEQPSSAPNSPLSPNWVESPTPGSPDALADTQSDIYPVESYRARVIAFADADTEYGWRLLEIYENGQLVQLRVPARAFLCAALRRGGAHSEIPPYSPVCPQGLKMVLDCPYHSDAWLGAGMHLEDAYNLDMPAQRLFEQSLHALQRELLRCSFDILCRGSKPCVVGEVCLDPANVNKNSILVVETASPAYADAALRCQAVIVATGCSVHCCAVAYHFVARHGGYLGRRAGRACPRMLSGASTRR